MDVTYLAHFPECAASILLLFAFGHIIGVLKSQALFQGKELQVTRFKVNVLLYKMNRFDVAVRLFSNRPYA